jgi:cytochrome P450
MMFDEKFIANPYPTYARLRESAAMHWAPGFGSGAWLVPRYEDVSTVLQEPRLSSKRSHRLVGQYSPEEQSTLEYFGSHFAKWAVFLDAPRHSIWRRLIAKGFTATVIDEARPRILALVNHLIDRATSDRRMDFIRDFARPLPALTMVGLMGVDPADQDDVIGWTDDIAAFFGRANSPIEIALAAQSALFSLSEYFKLVLEIRRKDPQNDLVSLLLGAENADDGDDYATPEELAAQCSMLLFAGHETTRNLIGNGLLALLSNPEQLSLLRQTPALVASAVKEFARFDAPAQFIPRLVPAPMELCGQEVKEGQIVFAILGSAQRDPEVFANPDQLDVTRRVVPGLSGLSFGKGVHYCFGASLANLETEIAFQTILERMPNVRLATGELKWVNNFFLRGLQSLAVEF